ncbi:MAG: hypothetical protein A3G49_03260 [Candidatus Sungbacteria bacterium RIFCSPLOWO2_12_FULL_41_11]|uniref:tRNA N6-adenosine threonylcarbamoyltransferase n=1 Tax=Candidatus Sungbacteria bacterium RIFCSPLOWO2_12_FULL_41_11 TaxID=1802286 RepID=A0A1G2LSV4_9BACT|nr:MAG: putative tRNA threonylcarbamoyladenosine biosynthesis protein Gcp [Parcubacteria group bacterium GW2011_GWA2_42_14]OHA00157.1 MAG: hypothetical protein A3D41_03670 [Candidatus Sungbacteria bacterium RIFCSPHIGHO2_02_FULL_41_12b]OHA14728.1 MAG: hypothetical protein A3G49_03260 [Candidatus Sungbacteria bacterium RIFCSPLOWO2_12_FULL_41_11]
MKILAIETSCDETAIAIAEFGYHREQLRTIKARIDADKNIRVKILSNITSSQIKLHAKFGGVVPNLAKREHQRNLPSILITALIESKLLKISNFQFSISKQNLKFKIPKIKHIQNTKYKILDTILEREPELLEKFKKQIPPLRPPKIDAIAVTYGPGLAPALWVGVNFAKALAYIWNKPLIPVNHMEGHLYSALLKSGMWNVKSRNNKQPSTFYTLHSIKFPALALLVSGGHTELVLMKGYGKYKIIGETLDDAAGEAFDKVARLLGLKYPGGPQISALAEIAQKRADLTRTNAEIFPRPSASVPRNSARELRLPRPMMGSGDYNFSFSGLKTAVLYLLEDHPELLRSRWRKAAIANEFQNAVVDVLISKTIRAAKEFKVKTVLLGGGVAANKLLRQRLGEELQKYTSNTQYLISDTRFTGDNALMIALAAHFGKNKKTKNWQKIFACANLRIDD